MLVFVDGGLKQLQDVQENADGQCQINRQRSQIEESTQQNQRPHAMGRQQKHLQHNGELLWGVQLKEMLILSADSTALQVE